MSKIAIVTDSTADLSPDLVAAHGITVVPLNVHFHEEVFKDGIDIDTDSFFAKLKDSTVPPRTSQPSPGDFHKVYKTLLGSGYDAIISIHISKELSGTFQSATIAKSMLPEENIHIVNSKSASMGLGVIVLKTAELVAAGATVEDAVAKAEHYSNSQMIIFAVDTLEYLHRNGRIGRAAKLIGSLLSVKPMLTVDSDGFVAPLGKVRGQAKVIPFLVEEAKRFLEDYNGKIDIAVLHGQEPKLAEEIKQLLQKELPVEKAYISDIGSVIGTHTGPGVVGTIIQKH
ncbi:MAG: DegV family protein [Firmicutes bacterium]|nr:DegV family protein [Bacillota bacterium]